MKGELIVIRLLCKIYRNGYYINWDDDTALLFAKGVGDGCQDTFVKDVVFELLKRGFFDRSIFERFKVLTSRGIQTRYLEATERYKRVDFIREFLLVNVSKNKNVYINSENDHINSENDHINSQRKGKEMTVKDTLSLEDSERISFFENANYLQDFEAVFWALYPRRSGKNQALQEWIALSHSERSDCLAVHEKAMEYLWLRGLKYVPLAQKYLTFGFGV